MRHLVFLRDGDDGMGHDLFRAIVPSDAPLPQGPDHYRVMQGHAPVCLLTSAEERLCTLGRDHDHAPS